MIWPLQNVRNNPLLILALLLIVSTIGCKKDTDENSPTVEITFPTGSPSYNVPDTINVNATVTDDQKIEYVKFQLTTQQNSVVASGSFRDEISGTSVTIGGAISVTDIHLQSGNYFIAVTASDGENEKVQFKEVTVHGLPLEREAILAFTRPSATTLQIDTLNNQNAGLATSLSTDFTFAAANPRNQTIMVTGDESNGISVLSYPDFEIVQQIPAVNDVNTTYYHGLHYSTADHRYFVTSRDKRINRYDGSGTLELNILSDEPFFPYEIAASGEFIFVEESNITGTNKRLTVYQNSTGAFRFTASTDLDIVEILPIDNETALVAANGTDGNGHVLFYYSDGNYFDEINSTLPDGAVSDLCRVNDGNFIIAHENGLFRYSLNNHNIYNHSPGINARDVEFDKVNGMIVAAEGNQVHLIEYTTGSVLFTYSLSNEVEAVEILYNK